MIATGQRCSHGNRHFLYGGKPVMTREKAQNIPAADTYYGRILSTPYGPITIISTHQAIVGLKFGIADDPVLAASVQLPSVLEDACTQLTEYFHGQRVVFDLPLEPQGTDFQKQVWEALGTIPYGQTRTYGQIAAQIGRPNACRAVGMANRCNPIGIFIPCHRVIGKNGSLTGYAGGLDWKRTLLNLEKRKTPSPGIPNPGQSLA